MAQLTPLEAFRNEQIFEAFKTGLLKQASRVTRRLSSHSVYEALRKALIPLKLEVDNAWTRGFVRLAERKGVIKREKNGGGKSFWFTLGDTTFKARRTARKNKQAKRKVAVTTAPRLSAPERTERKTRKGIMAYELTLEDVARIPDWAFDLSRKKDLSEKLRQMSIRDLIPLRESTR